MSRPNALDLQLPEVYELLVVQRGWTPERYGRWVADTLTAALLPEARFTLPDDDGPACRAHDGSGSH